MKPLNTFLFVSMFKDLQPLHDPSINEGVDPKTVQYLVGHENSKVTMDIDAKVKYNKPRELASVVNQAFEPRDNGEKSVYLMG